jgi:pyruvate kinase
MRRRTRIVATLGPATDAPGILEGILEAGVDVARINFSHGTADEHLARAARFREVAKGLGRPVAVLADLPGPKLRVKMPGARELQPDQEVSFSRSPIPTRAEDIALTEPEVLADVKAGQRLLLDDGRLQLVAVRSDVECLVARVLVGGALLPNKGINFPDTPLSIPALTDRDRAAIAVAARAEVDWLALSFVRGPEAASELRVEATKTGLDVPLLAKIERPEAVDRATAIIHAFDGIMVARGDLGVEIPPEQVPTAQKRLIALARAAGKPVVTATEMLDSMRNNPRPTRAEASDVANAIYDGTDAVMLSGETAVGRYPIEAVAYAHRIALESDAEWEDFGRGDVASLFAADQRIENAMTAAAVELAREVAAEAIVVPTLSGRTARMVARHRPEALVVAPAPDGAVLRQLALVWGLWPVPMPHVEAGSGRIEAAVRSSWSAGALKPGHRCVVLAGHPIQGGPRLPTLRLTLVGEDGSMREP